MTITAPDETVRPEPERARIEQLTDAVRRRAWTIGLAGLTLWLASSTVLGLYAHGIGFHDPIQFSMAACWLIGAGCVGNPNIAMRALGDRLTPTASLMVAAVCTGIAILLTVLFWTGAMHPNSLIATFSVILPEAAAIQAYNTAEGQLNAERREGRAHQAGYEAGREDEAARQIDDRYTALTGLERLRQLTPGQRAALVQIIQGIDDDERQGRALHLVPMPAAGVLGARHSGA